MQLKKIETRPSFPALERGIIARWKSDRTFERSVAERKGSPEYIFYDGPPFPTGSPHHGTIFVSILKDVIPRYKTMRGYYVPRTWGWDCHGLPIETQAEKELGIKDKGEIERSIGVKQFNDKCRELVSNYNQSWKIYIESLGRWVDMEHPYRTLDRDFMESVIWSFAESYKKGLIYKDYRVNPYCYRCQTPLSISDTRLDDSTRPKQDRAITVRFKVNDSSESYFLAWTTTPWTLPSNLALAFGAEIEYSWFKNSEATYILATSLLPRFAKDLGAGEVVRTATGGEIVKLGMSYAPLFPYFSGANPKGFKPILGDFVSTDEGTGIVHMAPAFGEDDYWTCRRNEIGVIAPVDDRGCFTAEVKDFAGQNVHDANPLIIKWLKERKAVLKDETIEHNYPHCWRCRNPLIYKAVDAWYFAVEKIKDRLLACNQEIHWHPETVKDGRFGKWLENARDWNISRNRYWATPIPVWSCNKCGDAEVLGSVNEIEAKAKATLSDLHKEFLDQVQYGCAKCDGTMVRTPEVLDGWYESGSMPYGQFHYPFENAEHFRSHFPADFIVEYTGQLRGWFYYLHVLSTALFDRPAFKHCMVHGTLLAADGKKISKSLKNYTDPLGLIQQHGADAFRAYLLASPAVQLADLAFNDDGVEGMVKSIILPLWNALAFFTTYGEIDQISPDDLSEEITSYKLAELDRYILSELESLNRSVTLALDNYQVDSAMRSCIDFLDQLNNWYIRRSRERLWLADKRDPEKMACYATLYRVLSRFTQLLAPFCPFITESVWSALGNSESVHLTRWPETESALIDPKLSQEIALVRSIISTGLALRSREKIRVRQPLRRLNLVLDHPLDINKYGDLIKEELNVKEINLLKDASQIAERVGKVNAKLLGPRFGKDVQRIIVAAKKGEFALQSDGTIKVAEFLLEPQEMEINFIAKEGLKVESAAGLVLGLETSISPELELEGRARDLVRLIQDLRKEANLEIADRIQLRISGAEDILAVHGEYITQETLAVSLVPELQKPAISREIELGSKLIAIALARVG